MIAVIFMTVFVFLACGGNQTSDNEADTYKSVVYVSKSISPQALLRVFEILECELTDRVAINLSVYGEEDNFWKPELNKLLAKKTKGIFIKSTVPSDSSRLSFIDQVNGFRLPEDNALIKLDVIDMDGEMKIPVSDTAVIKYHYVGEHLAYYDFLINIGCLDVHSKEGFCAILHNTSFGVASANGKELVKQGGPKAVAVAAQAVHNYFLGGQNIVYIMAIPEYGMIASHDPVAIDQACLDLFFSDKSEEAMLSSSEDDELRNAQQTIDWAEKIGLGSSQYEQVSID